MQELPIGFHTQGIRPAASSEITMGSAPTSPAGPHCAVAPAATFVRFGSPRTGANCNAIGAEYATVMVPVDCWEVHPCVEKVVSFAPGWLSTANESACDCASFGCCFAQDSAPASAA